MSINYWETTRESEADRGYQKDRRQIYVYLTNINVIKKRGLPSRTDLGKRTLFSQQIYVDYEVIIILSQFLLLILFRHMLHRSSLGSIFPFVMILYAACSSCCLSVASVSSLRSFLLLSLASILLCLISSKRSGNSSANFLSHA